LPTYFELLTIFYFFCAKFVGADVLTVETGLGGRLDPTNVVDPLVAAISVVELEHTDTLGATLAEIAGEKAGIIKEGRPVALAEQSAEALEVFRRTAEEKHAPLLYLPEVLDIRDVSLVLDCAPRDAVHNAPREGGGGGQTCFTLIFKDGWAQKLGLPDKFEAATSLFGRVQARNAALAIVAVKSAYPALSLEAIRAGLMDVRMSARFERLATGGGNTAVVDGAHTMLSCRTTVGDFVSLYGEGQIAVFGCAADKDAASMAAEILPWFSTVVITSPGAYKKSLPEDVYRAFTKTAKEAVEGGARIELIPDTEAALEAACKLADEGGKSMLVLGSFYLAAEAKRALF
jgi:dihydrofolate synthase/folylpolyglutamate synthase